MSETVAAAPKTKKKMPVYNFTYAGKSSELFKMWLVNLLLTIPTLGIYRFWAKAKIRRYQSSHLKLAGAFFEHTGTGKELFIGFLKVIAILFGLFLIPVIAELTGLDFLFIAFYILFYIGIFYFLAVAQYASLRYMASRTTWRGIRGHLGGSMLKYANFAIWRTILNFVSLGLLKPKSDILKHKFQMDNLQFGSQKFIYKGTSKGLMKPYLLQYLLLAPLILGLVIGGIMKGQELIGNAQVTAISSSVEFQDIMLEEIESQAQQGNLQDYKLDVEDLRYEIEDTIDLLDEAKEGNEHDFTQEEEALQKNLKRLEKLEKLMGRQNHGALKNRNPLLHLANAQAPSSDTNDDYQALTDEEIDSILNDENGEETFNDVMDNIEDSAFEAGPVVGFVAGYIVIFYIIFPILLLLLVAPYQSALLRKKFGGLGMGEIRFKSKVTSKKYIGLFIGNALITIFTLGFGRAIVWRRNMTFFCDNTILGGDLKAFTADQVEKQKASAGEGIGDALDMDMGFDIGL